MKLQTKWISIVCALAALLPLRAHALSRSIGRDIEFPKTYDVKKAEAIRTARWLLIIGVNWSSELWLMRSVRAIPYA